MNQQQSLHEQLLRAHRILVITDVCLENYAHFACQIHHLMKLYPQLIIDIWAKKLDNHKERDFLLDWMQKSLPKLTIYRVIGKSASKSLLTQIKKTNYQVIISLVTSKPEKSVAFARAVWPQAFIATHAISLPWFSFYKKSRLKKADYFLSFENQDCSWVQALESDNEILWSLPKEWLIAIKLRFMKMNIDKKTRPFSRLYFVDANTIKYDVEKIKTIIQQIRTSNESTDSYNKIILLYLPSYLKKGVIKNIENNIPNDTFLFFIQDNFFQLPATLSQCDVIISNNTLITTFAKRFSNTSILGVDAFMGMDAVSTV